MVPVIYCHSPEGSWVVSTCELCVQISTRYIRCHLSPKLSLIAFQLLLHSSRMDLPSVFSDNLSNFKQHWRQFLGSRSQSQSVQPRKQSITPTTMGQGLLSNYKQLSHFCCPRISEKYLRIQDLQDNCDILEQLETWKDNQDIHLKHCEPPFLGKLIKLYMSTLESSEQLFSLHQLIFIHCTGCL